MQSSQLCSKHVHVWCVCVTVQDAMDLFLGVHVVSHDEGVTIPSVLQQPRNLKMTVVR